MPISMDVFRQDAFSAISLTAAVDKLGYVPGLLSSMPGLFENVPVRTTDILIETRSNAPALIQTSPRGAPPDQKGRELRDARNFRTVRLAQSSRIMADELQNIRQFGSETELMQLQMEVGRRMFRMKRDLDLTKENLMLGCVQGVVVDADNSTIYNWGTEFSQTIPTELDFDLDNASPASGAVRSKCSEVTRSIRRGLRGLGGDAVQVVALAGDTFWDQLIGHPEVRETYLYTQTAADLREGAAFEKVNYGGITWVNYRGTDDNSTVAIDATKAKFFPVNAGIFQMAYAPAERTDFVNTPGQEYYAWTVPDRDRMMWEDVELYSYPLPVCTMPQALHRARNT